MKSSVTYFNACIQYMALKSGYLTFSFHRLCMFRALELLFSVGLENALADSCELQCPLC